MTGADPQPVGTEQFVHVPGADLHYDVEGTGPLVVWGHGLMNDRRLLEESGVFDWSPVVASGRALLRLDWRAHGASGGGHADQGCTWASLADDLLALLDELSPDAPVDAIGCSMGTGAILHAAVARPQRFRRLVLTAPPTAWHTRVAQAEGYRQLAEIAESGGVAAVERVFAMQPATGFFGEPTAPLRIGVSDELLPWVLREAAASDLPDPEGIRGLPIPTLILSWADDPSHPVSTGERLHELIPASRFEVAQSPAEVRAWGSTAAAFLKESA